MNSPERNNCLLLDDEGFKPSTELRFEEYMSYLGTWGHGTNSSTPPSQHKERAVQFDAGSQLVHTSPTNKVHQKQHALNPHPNVRFAHRINHSQTESFFLNIPLQYSHHSLLMTPFTGDPPLTPSHSISRRATIPVSPTTLSSASPALAPFLHLRQTPSNLPPVLPPRVVLLSPSNETGRRLDQDSDTP